MQPSPEVHTWKDSLEKEKNVTARLLLNHAYEELYPGYLRTEIVTGEDLQLRGVDVFVVRKFSQDREDKVPVQEKVRSKFYPDLFLEEFSSVDEGTEGWTTHGSADLVSFCWIDDDTESSLIGRVMILPFKPLQYWFLFNRKDFKRKSAYTDLKGKGSYETSNRVFPLNSQPVIDFLNTIGFYSKTFYEKDANN